MQSVGRERCGRKQSDGPSPLQPHAERILWRELTGGQMLGCDFDRDLRIGRDKVWFYCKALQLAVVVERIVRKDVKVLRSYRRRDARLADLGITLLRFSEEEVVHNVDGVVGSIRRAIRDRLGIWGAHTVTRDSPSAIPRRSALSRPRARW